MVNLVSNVRPGAAPKLETDVQLGLVPAWSYSTVTTFEECAYRVYIAKVKKIPEPSGEAADRGTMVHKAAEDYVQGLTDQLIPELKNHAAWLEHLRVEFPTGSVSVEGEWAYTIDWEKTGWMDPTCWARIKLDVFVKTSPTTGRVIDYKTGKKFGNEIKHGQQGLLYAIGAFMRDPELEYVDVEFWYTDLALKESTKKSYTRAQALMMMPSFHKRGVRMTTEKEFNPNPSKMNCKWCHFGKGEHPECRYGIY
jgi:RecB family exonuclease